MTKKPEPNLMANLRSGPVLVMLGGAIVCLLLIVGIFMPGGLLDSLVGNPQVAETPVEAPVTQQETPLPEALRPEKNIAFLADNAKKPGVKTTASGLQYKVLKATTGKQPGPTSTVTVNYVGKMIDGTQFDASRDAPAQFSLDGVIPGWTEGLQLMHEGEKVEFVIPQDLAYGPAGKGPIPPLQTLVFEVELLKVQ
jgi:FKBP-type peptidyl-prolyl cis-trans isomerase